MTFKTELTLRRHVQCKHSSTTAIREHTGESLNERRQEEVHTNREPTTIPERVLADGCDASIADTEANVSDRAAGIPRKIIVKEKPAKVRKKIVKDKPAKVPKLVIGKAAEVPEQSVRQDTAEVSDKVVDDKTAEHVGKASVENVRVSCPSCDATFKTKWNLKVHAKRRHNARDENLRFPCPSCDTTYKEVSSLREHVKSWHVRRTTICESCGESFDDGWQLYLHQRKVCKDIFRVLGFAV
jgi:protein-arginine kinase activator protein McsA